MQYGLTIPEENKQCHVDIEDDINKRKEGLFTFTLRVHDGKITDYNLMENIDAKTKYLSTKQLIESKFTISHYY